MSSSMKVLVVIPARYASTRLPGKPLELIGDRTMIHRVYDQVKSCPHVDEVVVATDDQRIMDHCDKHEMTCQMTHADHPSGTDRVAEVAAQYPTHDVVINVQGDEPFIDPAQISAVIEMFVNVETQIATQCVKIMESDKLHNFNVVKLVRDQLDKVLYFSRQAIPAHRDLPYREWFDQSSYYQHIGIYGYRSEILKQIVDLPISDLEKSESLEQLRWMEYGYDIIAKETHFQQIGIDTPDDLLQARQKVALDGEVEEKPQ